MLKQLIPLAVIALSFSSSVLAAGPTIVSVTTATGTKTFEPTDILQIVGSLTNTNNPASLTVSFADGTVISNRIADQVIATGSVNTYYSNNNPLQGVTMTGVSSLAITGSGTGAVIVKVLSKASEFVSEPVMLPVVDDGTYKITLETSVDMTNWAPAAPGDYLGSTSHRYFRVRAEKKDGPVAE